MAGNRPYAWLSSYDSISRPSALTASVPETGDLESTRWTYQTNAQNQSNGWLSQQTLPGLQQLHLPQDRGPAEPPAHSPQCHGPQQLQRTDLRYARQPDSTGRDLGSGLPYQIDHTYDQGSTDPWLRKGELTREPAKRTDAQATLWDNRFVYDAAGNATTLHVQPRLQPGQPADGRGLRLQRQRQPHQLQGVHADL